MVWWQKGTSHYLSQWWCSGLNHKCIIRPQSWVSSGQGTPCVSNMLPVLLITFHCHYNIWVVCVQLAHFNWSDWEDIFIAPCYYHHQITSINLTHCYSIFQWLCACDVCYIIFCHLLHIHSGNTGILFSLLLCSLWWVQIVGCVFACRLYSFVYNIISSSLCKLIWRHLIYKMHVRYILSSVWVRLSILSQLSIIQYMGLCVFSLPISLVMVKRIYTLSYYHHQIGSMNYYPLFRVRSWNNGVRCMSLYNLTSYILITIGSDNGLSPVRHQTISWTNDDLLSIGPLGTNFSKLWNRINKNCMKKMLDRKHFNFDTNNCLFLRVQLTIGHHCTW